MALASKTVLIAPPPVLIWLGTISYSLYLTHTTVQLLAGPQVERLGGDTHGWMHIVLTIALAISLAALVHHYLEEKMSLRLRAALLGRPAGGSGAAHAPPASRQALRCASLDGVAGVHDAGHDFFLPRMCRIPDAQTKMAAS